ncbi:hypothetical protein RND81_05G003000 [Saponaria officinalis]|uniref:Uncharacterized protein n=1 Tax=Saponaria officinalis TaxID=3572 RepID=A0AAW1KQ29_SAPOF
MTGRFDAPMIRTLIFFSWCAVARLKYDSSCLRTRKIIFDTLQDQANIVQE